MPSRNQFVSQRNGAPLPNVSLNTAARSGERTQDEQLLVRSDSDAAHLNSDPWRVLRIQGEFVAGFDALANVGPSVTLFGSARTPQNRPSIRVGGHHCRTTWSRGLFHHHGWRAGDHGSWQSRRA